MAKRRRYLHHGVASILFLALMQNSTVSIFRRNARSLKEEGVHAVSGHRFLAFGTSRAWGAGLRDRHDAYPFLLSPNVSNLAIRATGCEYPSLCTMSMVGNDNHYDVILIEYNHVASHNEAKHFRRLAMRLRHRFPSATMIFIYAWSPFEYTTTTTSIADQHGGGGPAQNITVTAHGVRLELFPNTQGLHHSAVRLEEMWRTIAAAGNCSSDPFSPPSSSSSCWQRHVNHKSRAWILETAHFVKGHMWELPVQQDPTATLETYGKWFLPDCTHYSKEGHVAIQQGILQLLQSLREGEVPTLLPNVGEEPRQDFMRDDAVGEWDDWDQCVSWFESGQLDTATSHVASNMTIVEFSKDKFAMEAPGMMTLRLERRSMLYISYMAGGPEQIYPKTRVAVKAGSDSFSVDVLPVVETNVQGKNAVHIVLTLPIGMVEAGTIELEMIPLEEGQNPFRVVGTIASTGDDIESIPPFADTSFNEPQTES